MSSWIFFVIIGQFLYAVAVLADRFIVSKKVVSNPLIYAFYVSFLSIFAIGALPFGVTLPTPATAVLSLLVALSFLISIYTLYESLKSSNPSEIVPVVGGVSALATFIGSWLILKASLPVHFLSGFIVLVVGMMLISHFKFNWRTLLYVIISGAFFGLSSVLTKAIFVDDTFINGFFWSRMANVVVALLLLLIPGVWKSIHNDLSAKPGSKKTSGSSHGLMSKTAIVIGNKILAAVAFLSVLYAIKHGDVSVVNALAATQYIFLLIFALFFGRLLPEYFNETVHRHEFLHKISATMLIVVGFFLLFL